jgi:SAM-dependent methyltransferase
MDQNEIQKDELLLSYHQYLLKKSWKGDLYRKYMLYPAIRDNLKGKALDVGCGIGNFLAFRPNTVGIDINHYNVKYCHQRGFKEAYLVGEDTWPFLEESFDSAILDNVLEHLSDPLPLLSQISRVLKKKGILVIGVPAPAGFAYDSDHKVFYTEEKLRLLLEKIGFERINSFHKPIKSIFLEQKMRQYCYFGVFEKQ